MIGSHKLSYIFSNNNSHDIATTQLCIISDTSVKTARNSLIKSMKKPLTSHNTLQKTSNRSNVDWLTIYITPQKVTIESSLRIFHWLMGSITLPPFEPDSAILALWRPENNKFNALVNHLILLFKFFIF